MLGFVVVLGLAGESGKHAELDEEGADLGGVALGAADGAGAKIDERRVSSLTRAAYCAFSASVMGADSGAEAARTAGTSRERASADATGRSRFFMDAIVGGWVRWELSFDG